MQQILPSRQDNTDYVGLFFATLIWTCKVAEVTIEYFTLEVIMIKGRIVQTPLFQEEMIHL